MSAKATQQQQSSAKGRRIGRPRDPSNIVGREALITATCELLKTVPPNEINGTVVARESGVDPSLLRYYFKDRSGLLVAAAERLTTEFGQRFEEAVTDQRTQSARDRLLTRINALIELESAYPFFHRLILEEVMVSGRPEAQALITNLTNRGVAHYRAIIDDGVSEGLLRQVNPSMLFVAVVGLCEFLASAKKLLAISDPAKPNLIEDYKAFICRLVLDGVSAPAAG